MRVKLLLTLFAAFLSFWQTPLSARPESFHGKTSRGIVVLDIDIISNGEIDRNIDLWGVSDDAMVLVWKNVFLKPGVIFAEGNGGGAEFLNLSLGAGAIFPFWCNRITVSPVIGGGNSVLRFYRDILSGEVRQKFYTTNFYGELDVSFWVSDNLLISGMLQYAWSDTKTLVGTAINTKTNTRGLNMGVQVDYFIMECVSLNVAYGKINSRSKEANGSETDGYKFGATYWF